MKHVSQLALIFLVAFASLMGIAQAQPYGSTESFRQTCYVRYEDYRTIQADCKDVYGRWVSNNFDRSNCVGDIANNNGRLQCQRGFGGGGLPAGSYQQTCHSCSADAYTLTCECEDTHGYFHYTSLANYGRCRSEIANMNGSLTCRR